MLKKKRKRLQKHIKLLQHTNNLIKANYKKENLIQNINTIKVSK